MILSLIAAVSENNVLGKDNALVWRMPADTAYFRRLTRAAPMLMGRKTAESPDMLLSEKRNVIVSRQSRLTAQVHPPQEWYPDLEAALGHLRDEQEVFVCGGAEIYRQTINLADQLYITRIHHTFEGDAFFPDIDEQLWVLVSRQENLADRDNPYAYAFLQYRRK